MKTISDKQNIRTAIDPTADLFTGNPASQAFSMAHADHSTFVILRGAGTGDAVLTVEACSSAAGANPEAVPFRYRQHAKAAEPQGALTAATASGASVGAVANSIVIAEVDHDGRPAGKPYVRIKLTQGTAGAVPGSAFVVQTGVRYQGERMGAGVT